RCGAWVCSTPSQRRDTRRQYGQENTETTNTPRRPGWSVRNRALMVISPMMSSVLGDVDPTHPRVRGALHVPAGDSYTAPGASPRARGALDSRTPIAHSGPGPSPRARGALGQVLEVRGEGRSTPACAKLSRRGCGAVLPLTGPSPRARGLSPHTHQSG